MMMTVQIDYQSLKDPVRAMGRSTSDEWSDPDELASSAGSESFDLKDTFIPRTGKRRLLWRFSRCD